MPKAKEKALTPKQAIFEKELIRGRRNEKTRLNPKTRKEEG